MIFLNIIFISKSSSLISTGFEQSRAPLLINKEQQKRSIIENLLSMSANKLPEIIYIKKTQKTKVPVLLSPSPLFRRCVLKFPSAVSHKSQSHLCSTFPNKWKIHHSISFSRELKPNDWDQRKREDWEKRLNILYSSFHSFFWIVNLGKPLHLKCSGKE